MGPHREFDRVLRETEARVRLYLAGLGVPAEDVDDLAQEAYLAWYRSGCVVPADATPLRWLLGIARNLAMSRFRTQGRRGYRLLDIAATIERECAAAPTQPEPVLLDALAACLEQLPERQRGAVERLYRDQEPVEAVAAGLGVSPAGVRMMMMRLRQALRACIERRVAESA